jgi:outer membrane protein assembly factor BamB
LRIRYGSRIYFLEAVSAKGGQQPGSGEAWLVAADLGSIPVAERPREPRGAEVNQLCPYSWKAGETHFAGPGVETADGDLIYAGTVYHGHGLQPGGSFVVRRAVASAEPTWVFRANRKATDLDHDTETVYVTYDDGEIVGLDLRDGYVRWRRHLTVAGVPVVATALTVTDPGRLLIGTTDGRLLDCSAV